ncbi:MAG: adenylosuccinate synthetase, partial [Rhodoglobus sp.]
MPAIVLIGAQWGDEGKGKATDLLGERVDYVVKFNGGNNAGHTVVIGDEKYALHLLPSGILSPGVVPVISNGVVVDIEVLFDELDALSARGVDISKLLISANAHVITQYHRTLDKVTERFLGKRQIGTTGRGIGPAYADKINRVGIRVQDLFDANILRQKVEGALDQKNHLLVKVYNRRAIKVDEVVDDLLSYADRLAPMVADTGLVLNQALDAGKTVLFEGGQATMLDVDHGTYPFVTSSNATSGGAATGSGVGASCMCVDCPTSRLSNRMTCRPRTTSSAQNPSGQLISCAPTPMISSTGGPAGSPRRSYAMSIFAGPTFEAMAIVMSASSARWTVLAEPLAQHICDLADGRGRADRSDDRGDEV